MERQLAAHLRDLIHRKKLLPRTRIPPLRMLADLWQTNYRTVQIAVTKLATEGLIVRSPMKGTFVSSPRQALRHVCIYLAAPRLSKETFHAQLNMALFSELSRKGVAVTTFFDHRSERKLNEPPPEVLDMVRRGDVNALIASSIYPKNTAWLLKMGIPTASISFQSEKRSIEIDFVDFARKAVAEAQRMGASSMGLLHCLSREVASRNPMPVQLYFELEKAAAEKGIRLAEADPGPMPARAEWEQRGRLVWESLLKQGPLPEVLVVYPDSIVPGVTHGLLQHQIQVPRDVSLISHRNLEVPLNLPFPVTWFTVRIRDFAQALIRQIEDQIAGKELKATKLKVSIERPTEPGASA